ncbi:MAG: heavy metal-associated domain-containing protein [Collinsella sp.]|nr:heavy metal-associated domain-containing protein [Collinsella sp.]
MHYTIKTQGLMCGHCDASVESELLKVAGVTDADADHETQTVEVEADRPGMEEELAAAVHAAGDTFSALSVVAQ